MLQTQMFPCSRLHSTLLWTQNFCETTNISDFFQKCFVSATNVSPFACLRKHHEQRVLVCHHLIRPAESGARETALPRIDHDRAVFT